MLSAESYPHLDTTRGTGLSGIYTDTLVDIDAIFDTFTEVQVPTQGQMAWLDDKVEALWDIADMLEIGVPREILDTRVQLLNQVIKY